MLAFIKQLLDEHRITNLIFLQLWVNAMLYIKIQVFIYLFLINEACGDLLITQVTKQTVLLTFENQGVLYFYFSLFTYLCRKSIETWSKRCKIVKLTQQNATNRSHLLKNAGKCLYYVIKPHSKVTLRKLEGGSVLSALRRKLHNCFVLT